MSSIVLPPPDMRFMGEKDDGDFLQRAKNLAQLVGRYGLGPETRLIDIGCGYGRLAIGLQALDYEGRYLGFDVLKRHVRWCQQSLMRGEQYRFMILDVHNERYNPEGTIAPEDVRFPGPGEIRDLAVAFSVFTHFYEADIRRYLQEIHRVLKPGGRALTTWFLFDEERLPVVTADTCRYPLLHELSDHVRVADPDNPLHVIAYHRDWLRQAVEDAGLRIERMIDGKWSGAPVTDDADFQDLVVLTR